MFKLVFFGFGSRPLDTLSEAQSLEDGLSSAIDAWGRWERAEGGSSHPPMWLAHTGDRAILTLANGTSDAERERAIEIWDPKSHRCPHCFEPIGIPRHRFFYHRGSEGQCPHCGTATRRFSEMLLQSGQAVFEGVDRSRASEDAPVFEALRALVSGAWTAGDASDGYPDGPVFGFVSRGETRGKRMPRLLESFALGAAWLDQVRPGWTAELQGSEDIAAQLGIAPTVAYGLAPPESMEGYRDVQPSQDWSSVATKAWAAEIIRR